MVQGEKEHIVVISLDEIAHPVPEGRLIEGGVGEEHRFGLAGGP